MANDGSQSLSQFIGDRIIGQLANNLGNLAIAFPNVGNSVLFANGATTASPAAVGQFNQMATSALGLTAMTLGNELQLLPNGGSVIPAVQNAIFGPITTGTAGQRGHWNHTRRQGRPERRTTPPPSGALQALPTTSTDFATTLPTVFSTAFSNLVNVLSPMVGTFPTPNFTLPTTTTSGDV